MTCNAIYKGDNTAAFGNSYITIHITNPEEVPISKIMFVVNGGIITKTFTDENNFTTEDIELVVNFNSGETAKLNARNVGNLVVYDTQDRQLTCNQSLTFSAKNGVICKCRN